ncbi:MAG: LysE family translocator [Gemmatimonadales bacterium]
MLTPGPNMMYTATTGAQRGPAAGVLAAAAVALGGACYTIATALGISAAMHAYPAVFTVIRIAGIGYLSFLGVRLLLRVRDTTPLPEVPDAAGRAFRGGLVIALTNPQLATFFLAFLPQFVVSGDGPVWRQLLELGFTFNLCAFIAVCTVGVVTGFAGRTQLVGPRFKQVMRAIAGIAFILLAVKSAIALMK